MMNEISMTEEDFLNMILHVRAGGILTCYFSYCTDIMPICAQVNIASRRILSQSGGVYMILPYFPNLANIFGSEQNFQSIFTVHLLLNQLAFSR